MTRTYRLRLVSGLLGFLLLLAIPLSNQPIPDFLQFANTSTQSANSSTLNSSVQAKLENLDVKGRAPKTGYARSQFGDGWQLRDGCDMRNRVLARDLRATVVDNRCRVVSGVLNDPYTGKTIQFVRGKETSDDVQIDHVVSLSNAWQTGAQQLSQAEREMLANDPLELLAVDGMANQEKGDGDAATWLPKNKQFRCQYVSRQIDIKTKYRLWVTDAERRAMSTALATC